MATAAICWYIVWGACITLHCSRLHESAWSQLLRTSSSTTSGCLGSSGHTFFHRLATCQNAGIRHCSLCVRCVAPSCLQVQR